MSSLSEEVLSAWFRGPVADGEAMGEGGHWIPNIEARKEYSTRKVRNVEELWGLSQIAKIPMMQISGRPMYQVYEYVIADKKPNDSALLNSADTSFEELKETLKRKKVVLLNEHGLREMSELPLLVRKCTGSFGGEQRDYLLLLRPVENKPNQFEESYFIARNLLLTRLDDSMSNI